MANIDTANAGETGPAEDPKTDPSTGPTAEPAPTEPAQDGEQANAEDSLPEWARNELKATREEAAARRVANRELTEKLAKAKTTEDFEKASKEFAERELDLTRKLVAATHGLTERQASRLAGSNLEELEADAKALLEDFKVEPPKAKPRAGDLQGGISPREDIEAEDLDPRKLAAQFRRRY